MPNTHKGIKNKKSMKVVGVRCEGFVYCQDSNVAKEWLNDKVVVPKTFSRYPRMDINSND